MRMLYFCLMEERLGKIPALVAKHKVTRLSQITGDGLKKMIMKKKTTIMMMIIIMEDEKEKKKKSNKNKRRRC
ncbi:uncharacterized protein DS421_9g272040 [Arachis hypogaea]|nr:uncharacterized protein DS421_9g272040 [Arachis hypogaea]